MDSKDTSIHVNVNLQGHGSYFGDGRMLVRDGSAIRITHQTVSTPTKQYDLIATKKGLKLIKHEEPNVTNDQQSHPRH